MAHIWYIHKYTDMVYIHTYIHEHIYVPLV